MQISTNIPTTRIKIWLTDLHYQQIWRPQILIGRIYCFNKCLQSSAVTISITIIMMMIMVMMIKIIMTAVTMVVVTKMDIVSVSLWSQCCHHCCCHRWHCGHRHCHYKIILLHSASRYFLITHIKHQRLHQSMKQWIMWHRWAGVSNIDKCPASGINSRNDRGIVCKCKI